MLEFIVMQMRKVNREKGYSRRINWGSNIALVSLFRGSNMTAVTSGENQEYNYNKKSLFSCNKEQFSPP